MNTAHAEHITNRIIGQLEKALLELHDNNTDLTTHGHAVIVKHLNNLYTAIRAERENRKC